MIGNFTAKRRRMFLWQMLVWTLGMFIVVPMAMVGFPYLIGMPWEEYGESPLDLFQLGGILVLSLFWLVGAVAVSLAHLLNPLTPADRENGGSVADEKTALWQDLSPFQVIAAILAMLVYGYLAFVLSLTLAYAAWWLGIIAGLLFLVLGTIALRKHLDYMRRANLEKSPGRKNRNSG